MFVKDWDSLHRSDLVKFIEAQIKRDDYRVDKLFTSYWNSQTVKGVSN